MSIVRAVKTRLPPTPVHAPSRPAESARPTESSHGAHHAERASESKAPTHATGIPHDAQAAPEHAEVSTKLTGISASSLVGVGTAAVPKPQAEGLLAASPAQAQWMEAERAQLREKDAVALLNDAKEKGVLFVEDGQGRSGRTEDDVELRAAVEECTRKCSGIRGILRIGSGHNDLNEPIVVVSVTSGFSEDSMSRVPAKVGRFATLVALPFELLPLKRGR